MMKLLMNKFLANTWETVAPQSSNCCYLVRGIFPLLGRLSVFITENHEGIKGALLKIFPEKCQAILV